jgi:hypothetical protein
LRLFVLIFFTAAFLSCRKSLRHERWISNQSSDTVLVYNPDFEDTVFVISPSLKAMIYSYEVLDKKQESESCGWMGDTLIIVNAKDSVCEKSPSLESNWTFAVSGEKERTQVCTFTVWDDSF